MNAIENRREEMSVVEFFGGPRRDSDSTVTSSVAVDLIQKSVLQKATQNNTAIDTNQTIHVGDVINYFNTPPVIEEDYNSLDSRLGSTSSSVDSEILKATKKETLKVVTTRNYLIAVVLTGILIGFSTWFIIYLMQPNLNDNNTTIDTPTNEPTTPTTTLSTTASTTPSTTTREPLRVLERDIWSRNRVTNLTLPIKRIIVAHTGDSPDSCFSEEICTIRVRQIKDDHAHLNDIAYNFLIGGDGTVFEGRGFYYEGEHTVKPHGSPYNDVGICVAFIGTFNENPPSAEQIESFHNFTEYFVHVGMIVEDHKIFIQDQLAMQNVTADALNEVVKTFEKFYSVGRIYGRDEWGVPNRNRVIPEYTQPIGRWMLTHTALPVCTSFERCVQSVQQQRDFAINDNIDIEYNFLIGGDGYVFEGRGYNKVPIEMYSNNYDYESLTLAFIGNFVNNAPSEAIVNAALKLFEDALTLGKLTENYKIHAAVDHYPVLAPGEAFMSIIRLWPRYSSTKD